jgi:hypothetical protein
LQDGKAIKIFLNFTLFFLSPFLLFHFIIYFIIIIFSECSTDDSSGPDRGHQHLVYRAGGARAKVRLVWIL